MAEGKVTKSINDIKVKLIYDFFSNDLFGIDKKEAFKRSTKDRTVIDCLASTTQIMQMIVKRQSERNSVIQVIICKKCESQINTRYHDFIPMQMKEFDIAKN